MAQRTPLTISLPPRLVKQTRDAAKKAGMTQSEFFRAAVRYFLVEQKWRDLFLAAEERARQLGLSAQDAERFVSVFRHKK